MSDFFPKDQPNSASDYFPRRNECNTCSLAYPTPEALTGHLVEHHASKAERQVRAYAAALPTPNVKRALALCESGQLTWVQVAKLFASATASALQEVRQS